MSIKADIVNPSPADRLRAAMVADYLEALELGDRKTLERIEDEAEEDERLAAMIEAAIKEPGERLEG